MVSHACLIFLRVRLKFIVPVFEEKHLSQLGRTRGLLEILTKEWGQIIPNELILAIRTEHSEVVEGPLENYTYFHSYGNR